MSGVVDVMKRDIRGAVLLFAFATLFVLLAMAIARGEELLTGRGGACEEAADMGEIYDAIDAHGTLAAGVEKMQAINARAGRTTCSMVFVILEPHRPVVMTRSYRGYWVHIYSVTIREVWVEDHWRAFNPPIVLYAGATIIPQS
jgi:hypothetical protein